jgi:hypothetical protein
MIKAFILTLSAVFAICAAPLFNTGWQDTCTIADFKADSLKFGTVIAATGSYCNTMVILANDTSSAAYKTDSIKFKFGYRLGYQVINASGKLDTSWGYKVTVGQLSTLPADTAGKWINVDVFTTTDSTTGQELPLIGMMDTLKVTGFLSTKAAFTAYPKTASYIQPWIKGIAGNKVTGWVKVRTQIIQNLFVPVRGQ